MSPDRRPGIEIYSEQLYQAFDASPLRFFANDELSKIMGLKEPTLRRRDVTISTMINAVRERYLDHTASQILSVDGAGGYVFLPEPIGEPSFIPFGFRETFSSGNHNYKEAVEHILSYMRTVDVLDPRTARAWAVNSIYEDFIFFESRFNHVIDAQNYANSLEEKSSTTVVQRMSRLRSFLARIPGNPITIGACRGTNGYRMEVKP